MAYTRRRRSYRSSPRRFKRRGSRFPVHAVRWQCCNFQFTQTLTSEEAGHTLTAIEVIKIKEHIGDSASPGGAIMNSLARYIEVAGLVWNYQFVPRLEPIGGATIYGQVYCAWVTDRLGSTGLPSTIGVFDPFTNGVPVVSAIGAAVAEQDIQMPTRIHWSNYGLIPLGENNALNGYTTINNQRRERLRLRAKYDDQHGLYCYLGFVNPSSLTTDVTFVAQGQLYYRVVLGR